VAIVQIAEQEQRHGSADDKAVREYQRVFVVTCSTLADGPLTVRLAPGIPRIFDSYVGFAGAEVDITAFCVHIDVRPLGPFVWQVTARYSSQQDRPQDQQNDNPLLRAPDFEWDAVPEERPLARDENGDDVVNSANERFDPPLQFEDWCPLYIVTRNESSYSPSQTILYQNSVNTDVFQSSAPRTVRLRARKATRRVENGFVFWSVRYEFIFRRDGWDLRILDQGYRDKNGKLFRDPVDGTPYSSPTLLDGLGARLDKAGPWALNNGVDFENTSVIIQTTGGTAMPDPTLFDYAVKIDSEEMSVTAAVANGTLVTCTVVRGANNTTASTHAAAATVKLQPVYAKFRRYKELPFAIFGLS
jgi:hypothetical protein